MCDKESYRDLRDRVNALERADAVQTEQIRTLFRSVEGIAETSKLLNRLVMVLSLVMVLAILALVYGAVGHDGFNAVANAAAAATTEGGK